MDPNERVRQVRGVIDRLTREGVVVAGTDGRTHAIFPVAAAPEDGDVVRLWIMRGGAAHTIEIGLGYGMSALHICDGLLANGRADARHLVIDPFQGGRFADCGLQALAAAGVRDLVEKVPGFLQGILQSGLQQQNEDPPELEILAGLTHVGATGFEPATS